MQDKGLERLLERIRNSGDINAETMLDFQNFCFAQGLGQKRVKKLLFTLKKISEMLNKRFDKATREDLEKVVAKIEQSDYEEWTKRDYKIILKKFYNWLKKCDPKVYPPEVSFIRTSMKRDREKVREIITAKEMEKMIQTASSVRDKALLNCLWQTGARVGEILAMTRKDVQWDSYSPIITLQGKTGVRKIRVMDKENYLKNWIDSLLEGQNAIWITKFNRMNGSDKNSNITEAGVNKLLKSLARKNNIDKRIYPHLIRSSRATFLASLMPEQVLKKMFGWTQSSEMLNIYISQNDLALDEAILRMNGMLENKEAEMQRKIVISGLQKLAEVDPKVIDYLIKRMVKFKVLKPVKK